MTEIGLDGGDALIVGVVAAATAVVCCATTRLLIPILRRWDLLDRPNQRSSHTVPTPRGGGLAVVGTVLLAWFGLAAAGRVTTAVMPVVLAGGLLALVCWIDDLQGLSAQLRLTAQGAAVAIGFLALPDPPDALGNWVGSAGFYIVLGLTWLWWINLYNFMDGIDGIAGAEAVMIAGGLLLLTAFGSGRDPSVCLLSAALLGAALGFLVWNWSPARIFLGDVGSAPLGFLTGFLLIGLAIAGRWKIALILPLYFLADATITLARRLARGERIWEPHRQHFYQHAVIQGLGHAAVVRRVVVADLLLVACAWLAEHGWGLLALTAAGLTVAVLLAEFGRHR